MAKDRFGCKYIPVRFAGYKHSIRAIEDVSFILEYQRSEYAILFVILDVGAPFNLFNFGLSFCPSCGRFTHFGVHCEVCWDCEDVLEDE